MDLCQGGNVMDLSVADEQVNEGTIAALMQQMVSAVSHLHEHNVVHSDIRPENWLFGEPVQPDTSPVDMNLFMIDFGLANKHGVRNRVSQSTRQAPRRHSDPPAQRASTGARLGEGNHRSQAKAFGSERVRLSDASVSTPPSNADDLSEQLESTGQPVFCKAPEQGGKRPVAGEKSDIWALGVTAYFMLSGQAPFHADEDAARASMEDEAECRRAEFTFLPREIWKPISSEAKNFIALCLQSEPERRPSAKTMMVLPWMRSATAVMNRAQAGEHTLGQPLPTVRVILDSFERIKHWQLFEKAAIMAAAENLHATEVPKLLQAFEQRDVDGTGFLPVSELLEGLASVGIPCTELEKLTSDITYGSGPPIAYANLVGTIVKNQQNMWENHSALSSSFSAHGGSVGSKSDTPFTDSSFSLLRNSRVKYVKGHNLIKEVSEGGPPEGKPALYVVVAPRKDVHEKSPRKEERARFSLCCWSSDFKESSIFENEARFRKGDVVRVDREFMSDSMDGVRLKRGLKGTVVEVDTDGDININFEGAIGRQWVYGPRQKTYCNFEFLSKCD
mmetsp:Transcript_109014/g.233010  ORF Transcript_109014/g.233010 Transcript_109014/m.233010 type:complete len:561 (-) Transcript_109014:11-1693(-)